MPPRDPTESPGTLFPQAMRRELEQRFTGSHALSLAFTALYHGAVVHGPGEFELNIASDCSDPVALFEHEIAHDWFSELRSEARARKAAASFIETLRATGFDADIEDVVVRRKRIAVSIRVQLFVRCRKCASCLLRRSRMWSHRAIEEYRASQRTWFGTITLRPAAHDHMRLRAQSRGDRRANDFDALSADDQFIARHLEISKEITLWLKRVRKQSNALLRYLLVTEAHISGLPHYHVLVHEYDGMVTERMLARQWRLGFSQWRLVASPAAARYVCKYLSKNPLARVRASSGYGNVPQTKFINVPTQSPLKRLTDYNATSLSPKQKGEEENVA